MFSELSLNTHESIILFLPTLFLTLLSFPMLIFGSAINRLVSLWNSVPRNSRLFETIDFISFSENNNSVEIPKGWITMACTLLLKSAFSFAELSSESNIPILTGKDLDASKLLDSINESSILFNLETEFSRIKFVPHTPVSISDLEPNFRNQSTLTLINSFFEWKNFKARMKYFQSVLPSEIINGACLFLNCAIKFLSSLFSFSNFSNSEKLNCANSISSKISIVSLRLE